MSIDHWMMFGTFAQQDYFEYPSVGCYSGVLINANMAAHAPLGLASFLLKKTQKSTYIIDPLTHAFQHDPEMVCNKEGNLKSSFRVLADAYGDPIKSSAGKTPLSPTVFTDQATTDKLARACVDFQRNHLSQKMKESDAAKYLEDDEIAVEPYALIAPYFYMSETTIDGWLPINRKLAEATLALRSDGTKIFASVVIDQGVLNDEVLRDALVESYSGIDLDGYLIWVDEFDEQKASKTGLESLKKLGAALGKSRSREVINTHGGFYSILLASELGGCSLTGVAHGPEFGETRSVIPVGGGIPIAKYYVPGLHSRIRYRDALRMFNLKGFLKSSDIFHSNVCSCEVCIEVLNGKIENFTEFGESESKQVKRKHGLVSMEYPTKRTKEICLKHYLQRKHREFVTASRADSPTLIQNLKNGFKQYSEIVGLDGVAHLQRWLYALGVADDI